MPLLIVAVIIFIIADILIRHYGKKISEKKARKEREVVLAESIKLDFASEASSLKRAEVKDPVAKILCVDDEDVILDSFRKILVLDGYSVDTVTKGQEALKLIQSHHYDFLFTDLKMPEMDGVEVTKAVKHLRPDIDVVIITGYASVETAVETMKYGAMDYVQKPFTDDELLAFVKKAVIKRQDRIQKQIKPKVHITHLADAKSSMMCEFAIPGGVFISQGHCWVSMEQDGNVKVGIDDFAKKLIGKVDAIEFPNLGMVVKMGQPLFTVKQGNKSITFNSPVSGKVIKLNKPLQYDIELLNVTPYDSNWVCELDAEDIDTELKNLRIGKTAVSFYQDDIEHFVELRKKSLKPVKEGEYENGEIYYGELEALDEPNWNKVSSEFFKR
ncbi:MAG TPA: response regulator [Ignavibacteriaceae bacterium]|jgi:CheY-like chemotaxis protein/glycine cleavage system H lipoate-binding protein